MDFLPHDLEFLREQHAHQRLGFADSTIRGWCKSYGLNVIDYQALEARHGDNSKQTLTVGLWDAVKNQSLPRASYLGDIAI